jgi:ABC-type antimicrobial peptide transport system permease subunit
MDPNLPVSEALPLAQVTAIGLVPQRIAVWVAGTLGIVGVVMAAIGIYGVTSYAVSRRIREIGIRMALGADRPGVRRLILRQTMTLSVTGIVIGLLLGGIGARLLESLLVGVRPWDPVALGGACLLFAVMTLAASYVPLRRATQVDPAQALRSN